MNFNSGKYDDQLLWNLSRTTNVSVCAAGNFYGSDPPPNVNITDDTTIDGTVVAFLTDNGVELHDDDPDAMTSFVVANLRPLGRGPGAVAKSSSEYLRRPAKLAA